MSTDQRSHREIALSIIWSLNSFDIEAISKVLSDSPSFRFDFGPRGALTSLGKRGFTKSEVLEFFALHQTIVEKFEVSEETSVNPQAKLMKSCSSSNLISLSRILRV